MNLLKKLSLFKKHKVMYLVFLGIIILLGVVLSTTYAKFPDSFVTANDIVEINLGFSIDITDMQEYQEINVDPFTTTKFNVQVTNNSDTTVYYGMWYDMIIPNVLPVDGSIEVGWITGTTGPTSGELAGNGSTAASIAIVNNTGDAIKLYIGVNSSTTSTSDIEYLDGKHLITDEVEAVGNKDINIVYVSVDGGKTNSIPTEGMYTMSYNCQKGSVLSWNNDEKSITYEAGAFVGDKCALEFTSSKPLLSTMPVGSYVAYVGKGGTVGSTAVACKNGGAATDSALADTAETEAPNSCLGQNAREDLDTTGYTYGYCHEARYKFYVTGWRLAYVNGNNPVIISAGAPECMIRDNTVAGNTLYIESVNATALKYCNTEFVEGTCTCESSISGRCSAPSSDAWAINADDFNMITKAITGSTTGGSLYANVGETLHCVDAYSTKMCGYNNDLLDIGGYYWFAEGVDDASTSGFAWVPARRLTLGASASAHGVRPVIKLRYDVYVTGGTGTSSDPFIIQ